MVPAIAQPPFLGSEREKRRGEAATLLVGPRLLRFIQHRHFPGIVQLQERRAIGAPQVEGDGDDDAAKPGDETGRLREVREAMERPQVRILGSVFSHRRLAKDALRDGVRHSLRGRDQAAERVQVTRLGATDQVGQLFHFSLLTGKTPVGTGCDICNPKLPPATVARHRTGAAASGC